MDEFNTSWTVNVFQAPGSYFYEVQVGVPFLPFVIENGFVDFTTPTDFNVLNVNDALPNTDNPKLEITSLAFANDTVLFFRNSNESPLFLLQLLEVLPVTPLRRLAEAFFECPGGCVISSLYVNDNFCDCPETCQDEDSWTCATCGAPPPSPPTAPPDTESQALKKASIGVGVGIGVGGGLALGLGLGIGLGTGVGTGAGAGTGSAASAAAAAVSAVAAFSAEGSLKLKVENSQILETEAFTNAIKRSIARIAGSSVIPAMVELIIGCAAASRRLASLFRRLAETVDVCFKIGVEQEDLAEEVCDTLAGYNAATVATVISSEILDSGIDPGQVSVIGYEPNPNPRANNPNAPSDPIDTPFVPGTGGINLG
ncbi:unnamed protein product [Symbiodinium sp. CCMP2456]|nr:unnamed protein product [Symbiodinium sp. CCMP2456]